MPNLFAASGIFHPEPGGPSTYLYELLPELQRRGWDVRALAYGNSSLSDYPYPLTRIPRRTLPLRLAQYALAARPLLAWADVAYLHTLSLPLVGGKAPRVLKIVGDQAWERAVRKGWVPLDTDIDLFQSQPYGSKAEAGKAARSREVRAVQGIIVPSEYLKRMVVGWGVDERKVRVIYNALPDVSVISLSQAEARAQLGLPDAPLLLTVARLLPWKGVDHLIRALDALPDVHLLVAGDGPEEAHLQALADSSAMAGRVTFLGRVGREKMPLLLRAADYMALYSGYEGLSHVVLESLRAGTPVIASDKGGNPEVVRHGVNGLLVPYVNAEALRATLREAFAAGKRDALAANAAAGMERFAFGRMVAQTDEALRQYI